MLWLHRITCDPKLSLQEKPLISFVHVTDEGWLRSDGKETLPETPRELPSVLAIESISFLIELISDDDTLLFELLKR